METLFRLVVFAASAWVSQQYANGYWVVGPVFGMAVVSYDLQGWKDREWFKHLGFLAVSTLVYALVYHISRMDWDRDSDLFDYFLGPFPVAIVAGSILMPLAHRILFRKPGALAMKASLALILSFYLLTLLAYTQEKLDLKWNIQWLAVMIAVWQGIYLHLFFRPVSRHAAPRR